LAAPGWALGAFTSGIGTGEFGGATGTGTGPPGAACVEGKNPAAFAGAAWDAGVGGAAG